MENARLQSIAIGIGGPINYISAEDEQSETGRPRTLRAPGSFGQRKPRKIRAIKAMASAVASVPLDVCGAML